MANTFTRSHWTATGSVFIANEDASVHLWRGCAGERNVVDAAASGGYSPYRWDGTRLHYGGNRSVYIDGATFVFEEDSTIVSRATIEMLNASGNPLPLQTSSAIVEDEETATLILTASSGQSSVTHSITCNRIEQLTSEIHLTHAPVVQVHEVRVTHEAFTDDWAVRWNELIEGVTPGHRTIQAGTQGRGILRPNPPVIGQPPLVRDFATDEPGGTLVITWPAEIAANRITPDVYGPATAATDDCCEAGSGGYGTGGIYGDYVYVDESSGTESIVLVRWTGVTFSGTINSATYTFTRGTPDYGDTSTNRGVGVRCEDTQTPAAFTSNPWGVRSFRTTEVQYTCPALYTAFTIDVTTLISDLLSTFGAYSGGTHGVDIGIAGGVAGWYNTGAISWIGVGDVVTNRPTLEITYTTAAVVDIAASSAGSSSVSATLSATQALAAQADGAATVEAALGVTKPLAAQSDGVTAVSATLSPVRGLTSQSDGTSTVSATLSPVRGLTSQVDGVATVAATLAPVRGLSVASDGVATVEATLLATKPLDAQVDGIATVDADLEVLHGLITAIDGTSTVDGTVDIAKLLELDVSGASVVTTGLDVQHLLAAQIDGTSLVDVLLDRSRGLATVISASSAVEAVLDVLGELQLATVINGAATVETELQVQRAIVAAIAGASAVDSDVQMKLDIEATSAGQTSVVVAMDVVSPTMEMQSDGVATCEATLVVHRSVQTVIAGLSSVLATLQGAEGLITVTSRGRARVSCSLDKISFVSSFAQYSQNRIITNIH